MREALTIANAADFEEQRDVLGSAKIGKRCTKNHQARVKRLFDSIERKGLEGVL